MDTNKTYQPPTMHSNQKLCKNPRETPEVVGVGNPCNYELISDVIS